jgi:hypothetical protein
MILKLQQDQVWKSEDEYIRIVKLERLAVEFKTKKRTEDPWERRQRLTKKEFCRFIKNAHLLANE